MMAYSGVVGARKWRRQQDLTNTLVHITRFIGSY